MNDVLWLALLSWLCIYTYLHSRNLQSDRFVGLDSAMMITIDYASK